MLRFVSHFVARQHFGVRSRGVRGMAENSRGDKGKKSNSDLIQDLKKKYAASALLLETNRKEKSDNARSTHWGTGHLRKPACRVEKGEDILIDESYGLQSRRPGDGKGLFKDITMGRHDVRETKYLYTVDERGINLAHSQTSFPTPRGCIVHSNISAEASMAGEAWFGPDKLVTVTINAGSSRFGDKAGLTPERWEATVKMWENIGYDVTTIPFGQR